MKISSEPSDSRANCQQIQAVCKRLIVKWDDEFPLNELREAVKITPTVVLHSISLTHRTNNLW